MISSWRNRLFRQSWDPSFEQLLLHLDGEPGPEMGRVKAHVRSCWSCRLRLEKIERAISAFMEERNASLGETRGLPPGAVEKFAAKLSRAEEDCGGPGLFSALAGGYGQGLFAARLPAGVTILLAFLGLAAVFLRLNKTEPVSANEVILQVRQAEARKLSAVPAPVIYEKLELRRSSRGWVETATWETWNDTENRRMRQRVAGAPERRSGAHRRRIAQRAGQAVSPALEDFNQVCAANRADCGRPLSPGNYELWRELIAGRSEEVLEGRLPDGERTVVLKASAEKAALSGGILAAELVVRAADWHPVLQRLVVQKQGEMVDYQVRELAFDVVGLSRVPASIFAVPAAAPASLPSPPLLDAIPAPDIAQLPFATLELPLTEADLMAAVVEARYALHSINACIGRPVAVRAASGRIEVAAVVETQARKDEMLSALRGIRYVFPDIRTLDEQQTLAPVDGKPPVPLAPSAEAVRAEARKPELPLEGLLKEYFAARACDGREGDRGTCVQQEIANLSRDVLALSERAQAQTWALRRITAWEPFLKRDELRSSSRRLIEVMIQDHLDELKNETGRASARLNPVLFALAGKDGSAEADPSRDAQDRGGDGLAGSVLRLCDAVEKTTRLTLGSFAETNRPVSRPREAINALLNEFDALHAELPKLEAEVRAALSGYGKILASGQEPQGK